jgi:hypothetical protein
MQTRQICLLICIDMSDVLERIKKPAYIGMTVLLYASYFAAYAGVYIVNPRYVDLLSRALRLFICMVLMVRFHPFQQQHTLKEFDAKIIFASAILILTDLGITQFVVRTATQTA